MTDPIVALFTKRHHQPLREHNVTTCTYVHKDVMKAAIDVAIEVLTANDDDYVINTRTVIEGARQLSRRLKVTKENVSPDCRWQQTHMIMMAGAIGKLFFTFHQKNGARKQRRNGIRIYECAREH